MINGGCRYPGLALQMQDQLLAFEKSIILVQMQIEESFVDVARSTGRPSVVVYDRGLLDIPACEHSYVHYPAPRLVLSEAESLSAPR